jgi:hypothetical protein
MAWTEADYRDWRKRRFMKAAADAGVEIERPMTCAMQRPRQVQVSNAGNGSPTEGEPRSPQTRMESGFKGHLRSGRVDPLRHPKFTRNEGVPGSSPGVGLAWEPHLRGAHSGPSTSHVQDAYIAIGDLPHLPAA